MSRIIELRKLRFQQTRIAYQLGELNQKIKLNPNRKDMKGIRAALIARLAELNDQHAELMPKIKAEPFSRADLVDVINKLADIESQIVHGGTEQGHGAIRGYIEWLIEDVERLEALDAA